MRTYIILGIVAVVIIAVAIGSKAFDAGLPVEAATARTALIRETIDERGKTRLPRTYTITMPFNARIEAIDLVEGTPVAKDQVVARIVPMDLKLSLDAANAAVERLEASIRENDDASVESVSLKQSYKFVESMTQTVEAARERVRAGEAKYEFAKKNHDRMYQLWRQKTAPRKNTIKRDWRWFRPTSISARTNLSCERWKRCTPPRSSCRPRSWNTLVARN